MVQDPNEHNKFLILVAMFVFAAVFLMQCSALIRLCMK